MCILYAPVKLSREDACFELQHVPISVCESVSLAEGFAAICTVGGSG